MSDSEQPATSTQDVKPDVKSDTHINLKVSDGSSEIYFKIKRSTPLKKLMDAFCKRQGKDVSSLRFLVDGQRVQNDDTPDGVSRLNSYDHQINTNHTYIVGFRRRRCHRSSQRTSWRLSINVSPSL